jgi:hypothetical protein
MPSSETPQDDLYREAIAAYGPALVRRARSWEADPDARQDLLKEIHLALWRNMATFDHRSLPRRWVYRAAHDAATFVPVALPQKTSNELHLHHENSDAKSTRFAPSFCRPPDSSSSAILQHTRPKKPESETSPCH